MGNENKSKIKASLQRGGLTKIHCLSGMNASACASHGDINKENIVNIDQTKQTDYLSFTKAGFTKLQNAQRTTVTQTRQFMN